MRDMVQRKSKEMLNVKNGASSRQDNYYRETEYPRKYLHMEFGGEVCRGITYALLYIVQAWI